MERTCEHCDGLGVIFTVDFDFDLDGTSHFDGAWSLECEHCGGQGFTLEALDEALFMGLDFMEDFDLADARERSNAGKAVW